MKITLKRAHQLASEWKLRAVHILPALYESQGIQGCSYIFSTGHPLEHINTLLHPPGAKSLTARSRTIVDQANRYGGGFRLDDSYHQRGPGNTGGPKSHSQFSTDMEAAEKIANALMTRGGIRCLDILRHCPHVTIALTAYIRDSYDAVRRTAHVLDETDESSPRNFVLYRPMSTDLVVVHLHNRGSLLHIQSAYPTDSSALSTRLHWSYVATECSSGGRTRHDPVTGKAGGRATGFPTAVAAYCRCHAGQPDAVADRPHVHVHRHAAAQRLCRWAARDRGGVECVDASGAGAGGVGSASPEGITGRVAGRLVSVRRDF